MLVSERKSVLLNLSLCHWKMKQWKELVNLTSTILDEIESTNAKAFYRKLTGLENLKEYEEI